MKSRKPLAKRKSTAGKCSKTCPTYKKLGRSCGECK